MRLVLPAILALLTRQMPQVRPAEAAPDRKQAEAAPDLTQAGPLAAAAATAPKLAQAQAEDRVGAARDPKPTETRADAAHDLALPTAAASGEAAAVVAAALRLFAPLKPKGLL